MVRAPRAVATLRRSRARVASSRRGKRFGAAFSRAGSQPSACTNGWAKDGDANTAYSQTVEPLPFHGMSQYPYGEPEHFPDDPEHQRWREQTLTRPALRLVRPLAQ